MCILFDYHSGGTERYNLLALIVPRQEKLMGKLRNEAEVLFRGGGDCGQSLTHTVKAQSYQYSYD